MPARIDPADQVSVGLIAHTPMVVAQYRLGGGPLTRHICNNCGATVVDEEFCPTCGAWIDPLAEDHRPPVDEEGFEEFTLDDGPPPADDWTADPHVVVPRQEVTCPSCGSPNPATNRHCEECGARLSQGPLPVAPRPAVQATAGVRALMAISALILVVVVVALVFNLVSGDGAAETSTTLAAEVSTTTTTLAPQPIEVLSVSCSPEGLASFRCENLVNDREGEWQVNWEKLAPDEDVTIKLIFNEPMVIRGLIWENLDDGDRFYQNYRAKSVLAQAKGEAAIPINLEDAPGPQSVPYASIRALELTLTITEAYPAEVRNDKVFTELAIKGITVLGRPAGSITTTTSSTPTTAGS